MQIIELTWYLIFSGIIVFTGVVIKLKRLWKGNLIEWLVDVCALMERNFGAGTGFLKLHGAYNEFVNAYPVLSKLISFERFSWMVDEALAILKEELQTDRAVSKTVCGNNHKTDS